MPLPRSTRRSPTRRDERSDERLVQSNSGTDTASQDLQGSSDLRSSSSAHLSISGSAQIIQKAGAAFSAASDVELHRRLRQDETFTINKLYLPENDLTGRETEIERLRFVLKAQMEATEKIKDNVNAPRTSSLVSITGYSGTGKTVLAKQVRRDVSRMAGFLCLGKFDLQSRSEPYTAFASAFGDLAEQILSKGDGFAEEIRRKIAELVGPLAHILLAVMPGLSKLLAVEKRRMSVSIEQQTSQLHFVVRQLVQAVCSDGRPLVLVVDDVQWADQQSLELAEVLLTDKECSLMIIATSRSNELTDEHPFVKMMGSVERDEYIRVETIMLGDLDPGSVDEMVAKALKSNVNYTKSLSDIVYSKTNGNAFFAVHFLKSLVDEGHLAYNLGLMDWIWEDGAIKSLTVADNVADLMTTKIDRLSRECQFFLKVTSCLGQEFDESVLRSILERLLELEYGGLTAEDLGRVGEACDQCVADGLLEQYGSRLCFAHDQIQEASFRLINVEERSAMQLEIGRCLLADARHMAVDRRMFLAVDLCNNGISLLPPSEKVKLASFNLRAAEKSIAKAAFSSALLFVESGQECLQAVSDLADIEELQLKFALAGCEAAYCVGDFVRMEFYVEKVRACPGSFDDKFRMHQTRMIALAAQERFDEGLETTLFILRELGVARSVTAFPSTIAVIKELAHTQLSLRQIDLKSLSSLPLLADERRERAIQIIYKATYMTYLASPNLFLILYLKAVRWSVKYGVCTYSVAAFAMYGLILCGVNEDFSSGVLIGEVALALAERLEARETQSLVTYTVFAYIHHWTNDLRVSVKPLQYGYKVGMETGDLGAGFTNLVCHDQIIFVSGSRKLHEHVPIVEKNLAEIRYQNQKIFGTIQAIGLQTMLNLMGQCENPLVLTGAAMDYDEFYKVAHEMKNALIIGWIASFQGQVTYLYEAYELSVEFFSVTTDFRKVSPAAYTVPRHYFYRALSFVALAQQGKSIRKSLATAKKDLKIMKKWLKGGNVNVQHTIQLIEAEIASVQHGKNAPVLYEEAIRSASRAGYPQDKALAHARAGRFFLDVARDPYWASHHIDHAIQNYCEWGATGVAEHLAKKHREILESAEQCSQASRSLLKRIIE